MRPLGLGCGPCGAWKAPTHHEGTGAMGAAPPCMAQPASPTPAQKPTPVSTGTMRVPGLAGWHGGLCGKDIEALVPMNAGHSGCPLEKQLLRKHPGAGWGRSSCQPLSSFGTKPLWLPGPASPKAPASKEPCPAPALIPGTCSDGAPEGCARAQVCRAPSRVETGSRLWWRCLAIPRLAFRSVPGLAGLTAVRLGGVLVESPGPRLRAVWAGSSPGDSSPSTRVLCGPVGTVGGDKGSTREDSFRGCWHGFEAWGNVRMQTEGPGQPQCLEQGWGAVGAGCPSVLGREMGVKVMARKKAGNHREVRLGSQNEGWSPGAADWAMLPLCGRESG